MQPDVSFVVPVYNAREHLSGLAAALRSTDLSSSEVVLVDDCSTDGSSEVVASLAAEYPNVSHMSLASRAGAGVARNEGFSAASGRYTLFFDADDIVHPEAVVEVVRLLDSSEADVAMTSYRYQTGTEADPTSMLPPDVEIWEEYAGTAHRRSGRLPDMPRLLEFTNYPWNKILRTEVYRERGLRFGETPVHNDILGHWGTLLHADRLLLVDSPLCTHVVPTGGRNLTNRKSPVRLSLFDALDETYSTMLADDPKRRRLYASTYWAFVMKTGNWAKDRTPASHLPEFMLRFQGHLLRMDVGDYARIRREDPVLARAIAVRATT